MIFVTGGAGLIGIAVVKALVADGYSVALFDLPEQINRRRAEINLIQGLGHLVVYGGTIMDKWFLSKAIQGSTCVIHLAAMLGVSRTERDRLSCLDININGTSNVLESCIHQGVKRMVFASSSEVYGEPRANPVNESVETSGKTVYGVSKLCGEEIVKGFNQSFPHLKYTILRFFNTYGEGQVAQFVITRFVKALLSGEPPTIYGDGQQLRSYCHVDDAAMAVKLAIMNDASINETYNIGNPNEAYTLNELVCKVKTVLGHPNISPIKVPFAGSDRTSEREIYHRVCDISKAAKDLGYCPTITLDEGIRRIASVRISDAWPNTEC